MITDIRDYGFGGFDKDDQIGGHIGFTGLNIQASNNKYSEIDVSGIPSVAVKCVDIRRNTKGEGSLLDLY